MPHPKKRKTKSRTNSRRSHHALKQVQTVSCGKCGAEIAAHIACSFCGYYKGREVIVPKSPKLKSQTK